MDDAERLEELLEVLDEMRLANETTPILVEGRRDVDSLRRLGFTGEIVPLHSGEPLLRVAETLAERARNVILLTDWDPKGEQLYETLSTLLMVHGAKVEPRFRDDLRHAIRPTLRDIESLANYVERHLGRHQRRDLADVMPDEF